MARRAPARMRPAGDTALRRDVVQPDKGALTGGGFTALLESTAQEILAVTYWFDPAPQSRTRRSSKSSPGAARSHSRPVSAASMRARGS